MISKTKYHLSDDTIKALCKKAGISEIKNISPLGAGEYNAVYLINADKEYVLKVSPKNSTKVLTYENDMIDSEVFWYNIIDENTDIKTPKIYYFDKSEEIIPAKWFIMEKIEGDHPSKLRLEKNILDKKTANMLSQIHKIHNEKFGYIQNELHDNWHDALCDMIENLIKDTEKAGRRTPRGEKLLKYAHKHKSILEKAQCSMVNYDLWDANMICSKNENNELTVAWIDPERSFWGDYIFDFICFGNFIDTFENRVAHYNKFVQTPEEVTYETKIRYAFSQGLMALIQECEKYYRYSPLHFGWYRNVVGSKFLYNEAFKVLKK